MHVSNSVGTIEGTEAMAATLMAVFLLDGSTSRQ